jgi:hypothetical protein
MTGSGCERLLPFAVVAFPWAYMVRICSRCGVPERPGLLGRLARVQPVNWVHAAIGASAVGPSLSGRQRMCLSDLCVVLIAESPLGLRVRSATLDRERRIARAGCVEDRPSDDGDQNDKQRCCVWRWRSGAA